eukprot:scaffold71912_cov51-Phaeocystis_antarctica.AAC.1
MPPAMNSNPVASTHAHAACIDAPPDAHPSGSAPTRPRSQFGSDSFFLRLSLMNKPRRYRRTAHTTRGSDKNHATRNFGIRKLPVWLRRVYTSGDRRADRGGGPSARGMS